ncbi:MAG: exosortase C-terminal domain/associated protein EpsI [Candidatus Omnitrophota bacterium]|jgi:EpsI family protein
MKKQIIIIILIIATIVISYALPKVKYTSPNIIPTLDIPSVTREWQGRDVSKELNLRDEKYNFISDVFARNYVNKYGEGLVFLMLDAGNFHNPKVCFGSSGYGIKELDDIELKAAGRTFKAHAVYMYKGNSGSLLVYWIAIDKKLVNWTEQKILQLAYSMFNKEKVGLMVRLDIPTQEGKIENSIELAKDFVEAISQKIPPEQSDYIFGKQ